MQDSATFFICMIDNSPHDSSETLEIMVERMVSDMKPLTPTALADARRQSRIEFILQNRSFNLVYPAGNTTCLLEHGACSNHELPIYAKSLSADR